MNTRTSLAENQESSEALLTSFLVWRGESLGCILGESMLLTLKLWILKFCLKQICSCVASQGCGDQC